MWEREGGTNYFSNTHTTPYFQFKLVLLWSALCYSSLSESATQVCKIQHYTARFSLWTSFANPIFQSISQSQLVTTWINWLFVYIYSQLEIFQMCFSCLYHPAKSGLQALTSGQCFVLQWQFSRELQQGMDTIKNLKNIDSMSRIFFPFYFFSKYKKSWNCPFPRTPTVFITWPQIGDGEWSWPSTSLM